MLLSISRSSKWYAGRMAYYRRAQDCNSLTVDFATKQLVRYLEMDLLGVCNEQAGGSSGKRVKKST